MKAFNHKLRAFAALASLLIGLSLGVTPASLASASTRGAVTLSFAPNRIEHTSLVHVRYSSAGLPPGTVLILQREVGTAHVWRPVERLPGTSGAINAPSVPQGRYIYRILGVRAGRNLVSSRWELLFSYAPVSFGSICSSNFVFGKYANCTDGTIDVGTHVFPYQVRLGGDYGSASYPQYSDVMDTTAPTTCRSVQLLFGGGVHSRYLELLQETLSPVLASSGSETLGTLRAHLDGKPWHLLASYSPNAGYYDDIYASGTFDCYSATGF